MASNPDATAAFSTRSSITSLWSNRRSRAKPSAPQDTPAANAGRNATTSLSKFSTKTNGARHHQEATKKRDEEAETWGYEASMGIGAGKPVKSDKDEELRGRILGKRRREVDGKGNEAKAKASAVPESDSEEEVGRSALGRKKKRRMEPVRPSGPGPEVSSGEGKTGENGTDADIPAKAKEEEVKGDEVEREDTNFSPPAETPPSTESTKSKRKKKNKKKRKATE